MEIFLTILKVGLLVHLALATWVVLIDIRKPHVLPFLIIWGLVEEYKETGEPEFLEITTEQVEEIGSRMQKMAIFIPFFPIVVLLAYAHLVISAQEDAKELLFFANITSKYYNNSEDYGNIKEAVRIRKQLDEN